MKGFIRANKGFLLFMCLFGVFRTAVADWNPVPSASMRPTLLEGDVVFVNRLAFNVKVPLTDHVLAHTGEPRRGDVVTFSSPLDGTRLVKRLVGLPGDVVELRGERLVINGVEAPQGEARQVMEPRGAGQVPALRLSETLGEGLEKTRHTIQVIPQAPGFGRDFGPVKVPAGEYLMLGDNRDDSADSRYFGSVPRHLLIGRVDRLLASVDMLGHYAPRFERFGMALKE